MTLLSSLNDIDNNFVIPLDNTGIISVSGEQQNEYLHGQLTVNVNNLTVHQARRSAHCDFKGKAWALPLISRFDDRLLLSINKGALDITLAQLNKYGVFSKVDIMDASDDFAQYAVKGEAVKQWISDQFGTCPSTALETVQNTSGMVIHHDYIDDVYLLVLNEQGTHSFAAWMESHPITRYEQDVYTALAIRAGIPDVAGENCNEFVPQMMNVQAVGGIDFNKGCYMGQEVVARTRYLGRNKRAAFVFRLPKATVINEGDKVEKKLDTAWRRGGVVIRCATLEAETWFMAILPNDTTPDAHHRLASEPDVEVTPMPLPYTLEIPPSKTQS